jgi:signal transduction histidine kinase
MKNPLRTTAHPPADPAHAEQQTRSALTIILGYSELMLEPPFPTSLSAEHRHMLERIHASAETLVQLFGYTDA